MNKPLIKVITGVRRAGKSALIQLLIDRLTAGGVPAENILSINMESLEFEALGDYRKLYDYVRRHLSGTTESYLFVDEVQNVFEWERAIASVLADGLADVTISGSNARLLAADLATRLTGRYVEIPVYPLLFSEFIRFQGIEPSSPDVQGAWNRFLRYGGFPGIHYLRPEDEPVFTYLNSLYHTIVLKDVVNRHQVREPAQLDGITRFLFDNCGNITTAKRMTDYMKAQGLSVSLSRVQNYLSYLEEAFLVFRCRRYDLKGMRHLELYDKFYMTDIGIRHGLVGYRDNDTTTLPGCSRTSSTWNCSPVGTRSASASSGTTRSTLSPSGGPNDSTSRCATRSRVRRRSSGSTGRSGGCPTTIPSWSCRSISRNRPTATAFDGRISSISCSTR